MGTHFFTLDAQRHADFLNEQRHDPVTGDRLHIGDEVAFCAHCKSAFLKSSWEYLGGKHCGQTNTLAKFPAITKKLMLRQRLGERLYPSDARLRLGSTPVWILRSGWIILFITLLGLLYFLFKLLLDIMPTGALAMFGIQVAIMLFFALTALFKAGKNGKFTVYENAIEGEVSLFTISKKFKFSWSSVRKVTLIYSKDSGLNYKKKEAFSHIDIPRSTLLIYLAKKEKVITVPLPLLIESHRQEIYRALVRIPESVDVIFECVGEKEDPALNFLLEGEIPSNVTILHRTTS